MWDATATIPTNIFKHPLVTLYLRRYINRRIYITLHIEQYRVRPAALYVFLPQVSFCSFTSHADLLKVNCMCRDNLIIVNGLYASIVILLRADALYDG
jgi:hypothetical protein